MASFKWSKNPSGLSSASMGIPNLGKPSDLNLVNKRTVSKSKRFAIRKHYQLGMTVEELVREFRLTAQTICKQLGHFFVPFRDHKPIPPGTLGRKKKEKPRRIPANLDKIYGNKERSEDTRRVWNVNVGWVK